MTLDNVWMIAMVGMFGLFLIGIWIEARRSLRALIEDDFGLSEIKECEADYQAIMTRLEARTRLSQIRNSAESHLSQNLSNGHMNGQVVHNRITHSRVVRNSLNHNSYNLG